MKWQYRWGVGFGRLMMVAVVAMGMVWPAAAADAPRARSPLHLTTSPLPISLQTDPGKVVSTNIKVKQEGGETVRLKISLMKFTAYGEEGKPRLLERAPGDDYFDWVKFDKPEFDAPNNEWQTIKMTINVPKTGAFGYYYAVVFSRVGDDASAGPNTNAIAGGTAVLVLLNVNSPDAKRMLSLVSFGAEHRVVEFLPETFDVKFENKGNVHAKPTGNVFVMQGKTQVGSLILNAEQGNILPNSKRVYKVAWEDGFPHYEKAVKDGKSVLDRHGQQVYNLNWDLTPKLDPTVDSAAAASVAKGGSPTSGGNPFSKMRFGVYHAHLFAVYDDGYGRDVPIESDVTFWVVPWRALLVLLAVLALAGFGIYSMARGAMRRSGRLRKLR